MEKSRAIELLEHLAWDRDIERNPYGDALNMAIEALKAQLPTRSADTISHQEAIDALRRCQTYLYDARDPELKIELSSAEAAINNLSTIQPEKAQLSKEGTTSDTISRQAALNSPVTMVSEGLDWIPAYHIKELPSAQPEQLERCPIYDGVCGYPSDQCYDCPRHHGAQPEPKWIPVSERLPETEEFVLASLSGKYRNTTFEHACEIADYADGEWCVYAYPHMSAEKCEELIEAWMPLPEAYKPNK